MNKLSACALCGALSLIALMSTATTTAIADDRIAPVGMDRDKIAGLGLSAIPPDSFKDILVAGELNMRVATLFKGKELNVSIFECTPATTNHRTRPTDSDEFVYVLSGKLILTEANGAKHEYRPGDSLVLPAGYTGAWEMQGNYREMAIEAQKGR